MMNFYRDRVDEPWRDMSSLARGISIACVIVVARVFDHKIGGWTGFIIGLLGAVVLALGIPLVVRMLQR